MCDIAGNMKRLIAAVVPLLLSTSLFAQSSLYSQWSNFPQSSSFFPLALWNRSPTRTFGTGSPYTNVALAMKGTKMNIMLTVDGGNGGFGWPASCGSDSNGLMQALVNQGIYVIPAVEYNDNSSSNPLSVYCLKQTAASINASQFLIGYNLGDE